MSDIKQKLTQEIVQWLYAYNLNIPQKELNNLLDCAERELPKWIEPLIDLAIAERDKEIVEMIESQKFKSNNL